MRAALLVPVKAFADAKVRLAPALDAAERAHLARTMATRVVMAAGSLPVFVVCDDEEVAGWAEDVDAQVIWTPGLGLNGAVDAGVRHLASRGFTQATIAHADLPLAADLTWVHHFPGVTLVPDRQEDGTNVMSVPTSAGFAFAYGPGSFARHRQEARRVAQGLRIARRADLAWDVDVPTDLDYCVA